MQSESTAEVLIAGLLRRGEIMVVCDHTLHLLPFTPETASMMILDGSFFGQEVIGKASDFIIIDYPCFMVGVNQQSRAGISNAYRKLSIGLHYSEKSAIIVYDSRHRFNKPEDAKEYRLRDLDSMVRIFQDRVTFVSRSFPNLPDSPLHEHYKDIR